MDLDDRLEVTSYHGAFHPVLEPWFAGWSTLDGLGLFSGEVVLTEGCTYDFACNYDPLALVDDGSCERESCAGCTFQLACNYDPRRFWTTGRAPSRDAQDAHGLLRRITTRPPRWTTGRV